jgi:hypothetical protein
VPRRTIQHVIGAQAAAAVGKIWVDAGAAVEEIRVDYGEDLSVQTALKGIVDPFRIWVQVKGKSRVAPPRRGASRKVNISVAHAKKWNQSTEEVIVVIWDITSQTGWYAYPRRQIDVSRMFLSQDGQTTLEFEETSRFDKDAVREITWRCRMRNLLGQYLAAQDLDEWATAYAEETGQPIGMRALGEKVRVATRLLEMVDYFESHSQMRESETDRIKKLCREFQSRGSGLDDAFTQAVTISIIAFVHDQTGVAPPLTLMDGLEFYVKVIALQGATSPSEWLTIHAANVTDGDRPF